MNESIAKKRIIWVDAMKGIGILFVVLGHYYSNRFPYIFHMALFFIVAGFFIKDQKPLFHLKRTANRLLLPYLSFLLLIIVARIALGQNVSLKDLFLGGKHLTGDFGVFWFIPVLCMSLCVINISKRLNNVVIKWLLVGLAIVMLFIGSRIDFPYNIEVVPVAVMFILVGNVIYPYMVRIYESRKRQLISLILLLAISGFSYIMCDSLAMDMKFSHYGVPFISVLLAIVISVGIGSLCMLLESSKIQRCETMLAYLGESSMVIMFLHIPIMKRLSFMGDFAILSAIGLSVAFYSAACRSKLTRSLFLGK